MPPIRTPDNIEIASLRKKQAESFNPLAPGTGTPWEDRGSNGTVGAFFKTFTMSLTVPGKLAMSIRRPETTSDVTSLVIGCSVCWGLSAIIHGLLFMRGMADRPNFDFDRSTYLIDCAISAVAAGLGTWGLFRLYNLMYGKLVAQEKSQTPLPTVLLYNVNGYALAPSVLALVPFIGPPLALLFITIAAIVVGKTRLRLRMAPAVIDAVLSLVGVLAVGFAAYYVGLLVLHQVLGDTLTYVPPETHTPG